MRTMLIMMASIVLIQYDITAQPGVHDRRHSSSNTRTERENKKQRKQEYRMASDYRRDERNNQKLLKKMNKQANKTNKRGYDANEKGNVFGL